LDLDKNQLAATEGVISGQPFFYGKTSSRIDFLESMKELTAHHKLKCLEYSNIVSALQESMGWQLNNLESVPFLPVRLFKHMDLLSVPRPEIFKEMLSSGTSGQSPSRIFLDRATAQRQTLVLSKLFKDFIGLDRPPILVIDSPETIRNRSTFSARAAGILGFSYFGRDLTFALNEDLTLNLEAISTFLKKNYSREILIFGFTSIIWKYFAQSDVLSNAHLDFSKGTLIHGGGWKKLSEQNISNEFFKATLKKEFGLERVVNYYGLVEQTGSLFFECPEGFLHSSNYAHVIIREPSKFSSLEAGKVGMLQLQSVLPISYPGHSILTEDIGEIVGTDDCNCGRSGQRFRIYGRIPEAEVRGCSDTFGG
jgi:hypothetical protein